MHWNWQFPEWPGFNYDDLKVREKDLIFLQKSGGIVAQLNYLEGEKTRFIVELLSLEGVTSAHIEGDVLERESVQSSIKRHFGLQTDQKKLKNREKGMAELMCSVYETYAEPLTHATLHNWHRLLFQGRSDLETIGGYRTHSEPMQIVSRRYGEPAVYFEAPPSHFVEKEMTAFIEWFNAPLGKESLLGKAAKTHVYFESIHPFEDGNGRIGRAIVEKMLSTVLGHPTLIAISQIIDRRKKEYYQTLGMCNKTLKIDTFVNFFAEVILEAQKHSIQLLNFLIYKTKLLNSLQGRLNPRQEKVLLRLFKEGLDGFAGGLSTENYIAITKTSRATATRDLTDLVDMGALVKTGTLRYTRYWLKSYD